MNVEVGFLELPSGKAPFLDWEKKLDRSARATVRIRIARLRLGNFGDCKNIKGAPGLYELRIHLGPGYRLYFAKDKDTVVIILCGGDKGSQKHDIEKAKEFCQYYKEALREGGVIWLK